MWGNALARDAAQRKSRTVSARGDLVTEAETPGMDLSEIFERALERSIRAARQKRWIADNRPAFDDYDRFVERHGVFSAGKRLF